MCYKSQQKYLHFSCRSPPKSPHPQLPVATAGNGPAAGADSRRKPQYAFNSNNTQTLLHKNVYSRYIQCESKKIPPAVFRHFSPNGWEFLIIFLHTYYAFISTLDYKFLFNYLQLWWSYAILSATTERMFYISLELNFWVCLLSKWRHCWRHVISNMFVDIIKVFIL